MPAVAERRFAQDTKVTAAHSRDQIVELMRRAGADAFVFGEDATRATIAFRLNGRHLRFVVPIPEGTKDQVRNARWRLMWLVVKSKLEAIAVGLTTVDEAFLAETILPDRRSVAEVMLPQIEAAYTSGKMPPLLPFYGDR